MEEFAVAFHFGEEIPADLASHSWDIVKSNSPKSAMLEVMEKNRIISDFRQAFPDRHKFWGLVKIKFPKEPETVIAYEIVFDAKIAQATF